MAVNDRVRPDTGPYQVPTASVALEFPETVLARAPGVAGPSVAGGQCTGSSTRPPGMRAGFDGYGRTRVRTCRGDVEAEVVLSTAVAVSTGLPCALVDASGDGNCCRMVEP